MKKSKSQKAIIDTYYKLKKVKPIEKISVISLCKEAQINKSTFYVYYKDIYDLADKIEDEAIQTILSSIENLNNVFDHVDLFTEDIFHAYQKHSSLIQALFQGSRSENLPRKLYRCISDLLISLKPEYNHSPEKRIMLIYMIYGSYYAFIENNDLDENYVISVISSMTKL